MGYLKKMGLNILIVGNTVFIEKDKTPLSITSTMVGDGNRYPGRGLFIIFTRHMGQNP